MGNASQNFDSFLKQRAEIARAYVNGDAAPLDEIAAHEDPVSFFPPNGGFEKGADTVLARYDKDAKMFESGGESALEILQSAGRQSSPAIVRRQQER
jgi:hypothetical protein